MQTYLTLLSLFGAVILTTGKNRGASLSSTVCKPLSSKAPSPFQGVQNECIVDQNVIVRLLTLIIEAQRTATIPALLGQKRESIYNNEDLCKGAGPLSPTFVYLSAEFNSSQILNLDCDTMLQQMEELIATIQVEIQRIVDLVTYDPTQFEAVIKGLEAQIGNLHRQLQNLGLGHLRECEDLAQEIEDQAHCLTELINAKKDKITEKRAEYEGKLMDLVAANIRLAQYGRAEINFHELNNDKFIEPIVEKIFGIPYYEQMVGFILILPQLSQRHVVFTKWYQLMTDHRHNEVAVVLIFNRIVSDELSFLCGSTPLPQCSAPEGLKTFKRATDNDKETLLTSWGSFIRRGEFQAIVEFGSPPTINMTGRIFQEILPTVIDRAWSTGSATEVSVISRFINSFNWNSHKFTAFSRLYPKVTRSLQRLIVGFGIKLAMDNLRGPDPLAPIQQKFATLKSSLPDNLECVVWHSKIWFRNTHYYSWNNEFLYAASAEYQLDDDNRGVYTWGKQVSNLVEAPFSLHRVPGCEGCEFRFNIKNEYWGSRNWFGAHTQEKYYDKDRLHVSCASGPSSRQEWKIELVGNDEVTLYHNYYSAYLYASKFMGVGIRRYPFLWKPGGVTVESYWRVGCSY